jgi:ABC-2 type transport system permease protein
LGYGVSGESRDTPMAVVDYSKTDESREYIDSFVASHDFELRYEVLNETDLADLIERDIVDVGILIPENFGRNLSTNEKVYTQIFIDGSMDPTDALTVELKLSAISQMTSQEILIEKVTASGLSASLELPIQEILKVLYNPNGDSKVYMIPGLIPILLTVQTLLLSALAIVREREQGTMEQLIVTPVKAWELMLGKIIPYMFVSIINLFILLGLGKLLFGITIAGSFWALIGLSTIFIIGSLGMGVLISNISQSQMQAIYIAVFVVLIPAIILSGLLFTRENMPAVTYWYSEILPVTQYLEITRGIMVRGADSSSLLWSSTVPLIVLSVVYFTTSVLVFRKRI